MGIEIERKFLLCSDDWKQSVKDSKQIQQGYLTDLTDKASVRIRTSNEQANINIKSLDLAITRQEYEYPIPLQEAREMLNRLCGLRIIKTRYIVPYGAHQWEIDVFDEDNAGLVVAEIELADEDEFFEKPGWLGKEVSDDPRYYNVNLLRQPYKDW